MVRLRGPRPAPEEVVVVALDRQSSKQLDLPMEPRLWPRSVHARLIERLTAAGAAVIVFDLIFNEPQSPETDRDLAQAMERAGNVILTQSLVDESVAVVDAQGRPAAHVEIEKTVPPLAIFAQAALAQAPFPLPKVPIKLSRYWSFKPGGGDTPTMPVVAFFAFARDGSRTLGARIREDPLRYLNFYGPAGTIRTLPYYRLMRATPQELATWGLAGAAVFVGQTESYWPKAKDGFYTVYARPEAVDVSGVEIAATAFANLLEDNPVMPSGLPLQLAIVFLWGAGLTAVCRHLPTAAAAAAVLGAAGLYVVVACLQFNGSGRWLPLVLPVFVLGPTIYFGALIHDLRRVSRERRSIRQAFGYFLPNNVVDRLSRNIQTIQSERSVVYSICLFTDAEHYTRPSETMDPQSLTTLMNEYYEAIFKPIRENGGLILQVVGDSVLSLWTAAQPDRALQARACAAALAVAEASANFNTRADGQRLPTRIGLHAGEVVLGHIGAGDHFEYRPVGDIVNTASRLEGLNKYLGTRVLVSDAVLEQVSGVVSRYVGNFVFVGKSRPVKVHELMAPTDPATLGKSCAPDDFSLGLAAFGRREWASAAESFQRAMQRNDGQGPARFYLHLCDGYRRSSPGEDWNGTIHMEQK
ncbi:MAG: adenylate/guanylate cyclase domain-containing protein [Desulfatitalea sp.]|nr:adenylate/guanylate cyclase domain-containing protein [Desulfatitalea sp.]